MSPHNFPGPSVKIYFYQLMDRNYECLGGSMHVQLCIHHANSRFHLHMTNAYGFYNTLEWTWIWGLSRQLDNIFVCLDNSGRVTTLWMNFIFVVKVIFMVTYWSTSVPWLGVSVFMIWLTVPFASHTTIALILPPALDLAGLFLFQHPPVCCSGSD
jgi:hypothetical protein